MNTTDRSENPRSQGLRMAGATDKQSLSVSWGIDDIENVGIGTKTNQPFKQRKPWNEPGHAHALTFSCFHRLPLLSRDRTRQWLVDALNCARQRRHFDLWAYVIMPEHVHLLIFPRSKDYRIGDVLKSVKQPVARKAIAFLRQADDKWLQRLRVVRSGCVGYRFWQEGGGYDRNVFDVDMVWKWVDYIHANPVRRGLVNDPVAWPWSSAAWYEGSKNVKLPMDGTPPPDIRAI